MGNFERKVFAAEHQPAAEVDSRDRRVDATVVTGLDRVLPEAVALPQRCTDVLVDRQDIERPGVGDLAPDRLRACFVKERVDVSLGT